jgi:hypothetical protein
MGKSLVDDRVAVAATARRAWEIDHKRRSAHAGEAPRQQSVRRPAEGVRANRLRKPGNLALHDRGGCLRSDISWRHTSPAGCKHQLGLVSELLDRRCDLASLVGHDATRDFVALDLEQLLQKSSTLVRPLATRNAVRDRQDGDSQTSSFVFSSRRTSVRDIESSTAFAMS